MNALLSFLCTELTFVSIFLCSVYIAIWSWRIYCALTSGGYKFFFRRQVISSEGILLSGATLSNYRTLRQIFFRVQAKRTKKVQRYHRELLEKFDGSYITPHRLRRYDNLTRRLDTVVADYDHDVSLYNDLMEATAFKYVEHAYTPDGELLLPRQLSRFNNKHW